MPPVKYKPKYAKLLLDHMGKGLSFQTFGAVVGVVRSTIYKWVDDYPEFKEAKDIGNAMAQDYMEQRLMAKISGNETEGLNLKDIDNSCLIFALKTRFHKTYGEKKDVKMDISSIKIDTDDAGV